MIRSNRRLTIRENSDHTNISHGSVQNILTTDLCTSWVSAKFVSRVLTVKQKQQRLSILLELRDCASSDSSILGNETWISGYDPVTSVSKLSTEITQVSWCEKRHVKQVPTSRWWWLFLTLMESCELSMYPGTLQWTLNIIRAIREFKKQCAWKKAWQMSKRFHPSSWQHSVSHIASGRAISAIKNIIVWPHPHYSPDLAPCYFWLYPKVKMTI
jgi:histone-lysine N-methyltransferase SETMAR